MLVADKLVELNERLVQSPHVATIEIPLPDRDEREQFVPVATDGQELSKLADFTADQLAEISNGLSLMSLNVVLAQAARTGKRLDAARFRQLKKSMIERQCQGLVEFIEPKHTLDLVVGLDAAKKRLAARRQVDQRGPARIGADGLSGLRPGRHRQDRFWPSAMPARSAFRASCCATFARSTSAKRKATWSRCSACCGRWGRSW